MIDTPDLRLELLKIAVAVTGSHAALMKVAEHLREYVLAPGVPTTTLHEALDESRTIHDD